jgi:hypothetical protein
MKNNLAYFDRTRARLEYLINKFPQRLQAKSLRRRLTQLRDVSGHSRSAMVRGSVGVLAKKKKKKEQPQSDTEGRIGHGS